MNSRKNCFIVSRQTRVIAPVFLRTATVCFMIKELFNAVRGELGISLVSCGCNDNVTDAGVSFCASGDGCCVVLISGGAALLDCGGVRHSLKKGDYFVLRADSGEGVLSAADGGKLSVCRMEFCGKNASACLAEAGVEPSFGIAHAEGTGFRSAVMNCIDYYDSNKSHLSQLKLTAFLLDALSSLRQPGKKQGRARTAGQAERALRFIEYNYMHGISARDIALQLNMDRTHFFRIFKAKTGISPEKYIINFRVSKACEILKKGTCSIGETAALVGINDVYYFSKLFKKITGQSPTEYRKAQIAAEG